MQSGARGRTGEQHLYPAKCGSVDRRGEAETGCPSRRGTEVDGACHEAPRPGLVRGDREAQSCMRARAEGEETWRPEGAHDGAQETVFRSGTTMGHAREAAMRSGTLDVASWSGAWIGAERCEAHTGVAAEVPLRPGPGGYANPGRHTRYTQWNSIGDPSPVCGSAVVSPPPWHSHQIQKYNRPPEPDWLHPDLTVPEAREDQSLY
ncbi:hypothetical protein NDU88_006925 [Pleurodeles waltl]|uniref:Uncharacterized protein n=1 Tax=Pleurodeles waltl TaxID=8319 RepID=A0AAV7RNV5_PLEWA|nr:hypothetical protein NDU88_006925 [Pleurodeles waltl]